MFQLDRGGRPVSTWDATKQVINSSAKTLAERSADEAASAAAFGRWGLSELGRVGRERICTCEHVHCDRTVETWRCTWIRSGVHLSTQPCLDHLAHVWLADSCRCRHVHCAVCGGAQAVAAVTPLGAAIGPSVRMHVRWGTGDDAADPLGTLRICDWMCARCLDRLG